MEHPSEGFCIRAELGAENSCREIVRFLELTEIADRAVP